MSHIFPSLIANIGGNTSGATANIATGTILLAGGNNITLSQNGNSVTISGAAGGGGGADGYNILAAGTQTAGTANTVVFSNSNGITFGMSNSSVITASHNGITSQSVQTQNMVSVQGSTGNISFANGNGITFGGNASTVTASHNGLTSQSNQAVSAGNGSSTFQTLSFADGNGVSFSTAAGGIVATVRTDYQSSNANYLTSQSNQNVTAANGGFAFQTLSFSNANGVSFGTSAGSAITASHNGLTSQSNQAFSAGGGSSAFQTLSFNNANGATFSNVGGAVQLSYTVPAVPAQTNQTIGGYAVGNTTGQSSSSTFDARTVSIQGAGAASVGYSNGSIIISAPNAAAGNVTFSAGTTSNGLADVVFSNSNGVSFGLNGSTITASVNAGGGAAYTHSSYYYPQDRLITAVSAPANGSMSVQMLLADVNYSGSRLDLFVSMSPISSADNRTFSFVYSHWCGIYTNNAGTLSSMSTASLATTLGTWSSNATASAGSLRAVSLPFDVNLSEGMYYIAHILSTRVISTSTSSQTVAAMNMTMHGGAFLTANNYHDIGVGTSASRNEFFFGQGIYGTTTNAVPATINLTGVVASGTGAARANLAVKMRA